MQVNDNKEETNIMGKVKMILKSKRGVILIVLVTVATMAFAGLVMNRIFSTPVVLNEVKRFKVE